MFQRLFSAIRVVFVLSVFFAAGHAAAQSAPGWPNLEEVIVVSKTHFDDINITTVSKP